jgi:hypothetical protein
MTKKIEVLAAENQEDLENLGANYYSDHCDTIKEAKILAKRYLTEEYRISAESSVKMGYSQVLVNGECLYDFFGK